MGNWPYKLEDTSKKHYKIVYHYLDGTTKTYYSSEFYSKLEFYNKLLDHYIEHGELSKGELLDVAIQE